MKIHQTLPRDLVSGWVQSTERHPGKKQFPFHYHNVEEWLEVQSGEICFVTIAKAEYRLTQGQALEIAPGEIHRVEVGPDGVEYQMWVPTLDDHFYNALDPEDISWIEKNLAVPEAENSGNSAFLGNFLARELTFRAANGKFFDRGGFLKRAPGDNRRIASDSVCVLHKDADSVLLSTVVHMEPKKGGERQSFSNYRLFVRDGDRWRCRVWINHQEPAAI